MPKNPLLQKRALDALLETMTTDSYESLGAHRRGEPWLPEGKGTELNSVQDGGESVMIPPTDLKISSKRDLGRMYHGSKVVIKDSTLRRFQGGGSSDSGAIFLTSDVDYANSYKGTSGALYAVELGSMDIFDPENEQDMERLADGYRALVGSEYDDEESAMSDYESAVGGRYGDLLDWAVGSQILEAVEAAGFDGMRMRERPGTISGQQGQGFTVSGNPIESVALFKGPIRAQRVDVPEKQAATIYRRPKSKAYEQIAKAHPDWSIEQIESQAALVSLGAKPLEDVLAEVAPQEIKEARPIKPIEDDLEAHQFFKEAPRGKMAGHRVKDTGEYDEAKEARIRKVAQETANYFEHGPMFDPKGGYLCKDCHYMLGNKACAFVEGDIDREFGACRYWKIADGKAPIELERKYSKKEADYVERKPKAGFGCKRCEYGVGQAKKADSDGREAWCEFYGMHIIPDACCAKNSMHGDITFNDDNTVSKQGSFVSVDSLVKTAAKTLYHVTFTNKVPSIKQKGILPMQTTNWVKGPEGERYGEGEIFACDNLIDAVRWGARMDWAHHEGMGTGKISIVVFNSAPDQKWKRDTSDPMSQAANKGKWLKSMSSVKPENIVSSHPITQDMVKAVTQNQEVKLAYRGYEAPTTGIVEEYTEKIRRPRVENQGFGLPDREFEIVEGVPTSRRPSMEEQESKMSAAKPKCPHCGSSDYGLMPTDFETAKCNDCGKNWDHGIVDGINNPYEKTADVPTKSYGMGTPIGGTDNPDAGASDEPEELQDPGELSLNMTSAKIAALGDDIGWFYKSARPTEQKIELLQKQFNLTPEQIEQCIQTDPSKNQTDFVPTIAKWLGRQLIKLPEDSARLKQQLEVFDKLKKSPKFVGNKDLQSYTPDKLFEVVEQNEANLSKKEKTRQDVTKGAEVIVKDGDLVIYKVTTPEAHMELSGGTNWCTAHRSHSTRYLKDGPAYIMFKGGSAFAQLHPPSDQLMNRSDVCMVQSIEDEGQVIAKFIDDPTALRGLQLLAKKAPDVEAWVKENASDPATLVEILGKKKEEEAQRGTESRQMAVQHAIASGQPLSAEEEALLPKRVELPLLMRYGQKFHAGKRWAPLEKAIIASKDLDQQVADYALEFFKARWPQGENKLLKAAFKPSKNQSSWDVQKAQGAAIDYALRVIKGRWQEYEDAMWLATSNQGTSWGATHYAIEVLKAPWSKAPGIGPLPDGTFHQEKLVNSQTKNEHLYAAKFFPNVMWDEFKQWAEAAGLDERNFRPDKDLWIVQEWVDLGSCVYNIGNGAADDAMDYALQQETAPDQTLPSDEEMVKEIVPQLSYNAMRRIGESLQQEEPDVLREYAERQQRYGNGNGQIDFTDERTLSEVLLTVEAYSPGSSVWKNINEAYRQGTARQYEGELVNELHYELTDGMKERNEGYTELRYGKDFADSFGYEWKVGPVYEVLDRWGAARMLKDGTPTDISGGQLELWVNPDIDMSEREDATMEAPELMDKWYTKGQQQERDPRQMQLQFKSHLLKKKALVQMHESPTVLPPRNDIKEHLDQQIQDQLSKEVRQGVVEPLNPKKKNKRQQIDPRINPDGVVAALSGKDQSYMSVRFKGKEKMLSYSPQDIMKAIREVEFLSMANPGFPVVFILDEAGIVSEETYINGNIVGETKEYESTKTAEYSDADAERDEEAQYFLEQVEDMQDEARRYFMQEDYLKQEAQDRNCSMEELWDLMGDEYTAEFYGTPYERVPDFTDQEVPQSKQGAENPIFTEIDALWKKEERPDDDVIKRIGEYLLQSQKATSRPSAVVLAERWRESRWPNWHPDDKGFLESMKIKGSKNQLLGGK